MLKIRLQKVGKKNSPSYRVVLCEHTAPPQGKFIEILGSYNARLKKKGFKKERIEYWLSKGAQPSPTVHNLLVDEGILKGIKLKAWRPKKKEESSVAKAMEGKEIPEKKVETPEPEAKKTSAPDESTADKKSPDLPAEADKAKAEVPQQRDEGGKEKVKPKAIDKQEKID